jgi:hypothetical protein
MSDVKREAAREALRNPVPHRALRRLEALVGEWDMWARGGQAGPVRGRFGWAEGGAFLVQRTDVTATTSVPAAWEGRLPFPTVTMTGYDDFTGEFTTLYSDGRGVARVYGTAVGDGAWRMWRSAAGFHQRFSATVDAVGGTIDGAWEWSSDGTAWERDFDVAYVRVQ